MSASDAAPLPRLGEVFFDVRGHSRSMRLSWYADTGIAVFSIWQGGRCTGTFRLPIDDLPRMIEILQRGPQGGRAEPGPVFPEPADHRTSADQRGSSGRGYEPDETAAYDQTGGYQRDGYERDGYERQGYADAAAYGQAPPRDEPAQALPDYAGAAGYDDARRYRRAAGYEYGGPAGEPVSDSRRKSRAGTAWRDEGGYQLDATGQGGYDRAELDQYSQERFVPPYVRPAADSYPNDNPEADQARGRARRGAAYPGDAPADYPPPDPYPLQPRSQRGYSGDSEYRLTADPEGPARHSAGKHSSHGRARGSAAARGHRAAGGRAAGGRRAGPAAGLLALTCALTAGGQRGGWRLAAFAVTAGAAPGPDLPTPVIGRKERRRSRRYRCDEAGNSFCGGRGIRKWLRRSLSRLPVTTTHERFPTASI